MEQFLATMEHQKRYWNLNVLKERGAKMSTKILLVRVRKVIQIVVFYSVYERPLFPGKFNFIQEY